MPKDNQPGNLPADFVALERRVEWLERSVPSAWHTVTAAAYTAPFEDYVTAAPGSGWRPVGYYVDPYGECWLRGLAYTTGSLTANTPAVILTLPVGVRPAASEGPFTVNAITADRFVRVDVLVDGTVTVNPGSTPAGPGYLSLAGIHFSTVD